jgi:hypothetical protein
MLLEKPMSNGDVISMKLITGEEIIARFEEETNDYVKVTRPLAVTLGPQGLGMIPFMFLTEKDSFKIKQAHILVSGPAKKDAGDQYMQGTTGIAMA